MKHIKDYFDNFEACKLESLFDELYQDDWKVSEENLVDSFGTEWNFGDINYFVSFTRNTFNIIVAGYKMFLEFKDIINEPPTKDVERIQEKLESANSKIKLLEEQNGNLKKELDTRRKELHDLKTSVKSQKPSKAEVPVESPKPKEYISLRRRKYVKIE
jgi:hypothetical protein